MLKHTTFKFLGATLLTLGIMFAILPGAPDNAPEADAAAPDNSFVIENARVFDGNSVIDDTRIVVREGRVSAIGDNDAAKDLPVIDATGKTLLPGLIDAHTHTWGVAQQDALRFGVTTMLDMFTAPEMLPDAIAARDTYAATNNAALFSAGMLATTEGGHGTQYGVGVETLSAPEQAQGWVARRKAEGSDYIKLVYIPESRNTPSIDLAIATAVIEAAHAQDLLAVAHISTIAAAEALLDAGIDGLVHVYFDAPASDDFLQRANDRGVFVIPTLAITSVIDGQRPGEQLIADDNVAAYLQDSQRAMLSQTFGIQQSRGLAATSRDNVRALHTAGVTILAGSDAPNPSTAHGATLHQEMAYLVAAGLTPLDALRAATSLPAKTFGLDGRGTIAVGSRADLLLVDGDPLQDISATLRIAGIYRNGYPVSRDTAPQDADSAVATRMAPSSLGTFEDDIDAPEGFIWTPTSDEMMGGKSSAALSLTAPGAANSDGALRVLASNAPGFAFPWAGAFIAAQNSTSVSDYNSVAFDIRGDAARYRLMLFSTGAMGAPPTLEFDVTPDWQHIELTITDVPGFARDKFAGFAIVTPMTTGDYEFTVDNVDLLP